MLFRSVSQSRYLGGPPSKAKYYLLTDSEQVPRGKDEKNPDKGSEIDRETIYLQTVRGSLKGLITYLLHYDSASYDVWQGYAVEGEAVGKPSLKRAK